MACSVLLDIDGMYPFLYENADHIILRDWLSNIKYSNTMNNLTTQNENLTNEVYLAGEKWEKLKRV